MARDRIKSKGRRESGRFAPLPINMLESRNFRNLSARGRSLLFEFCAQLRFNKDGTANNGDLQATFSLMRDRGWKSKAGLALALQELEHYGFIVTTRQGGKKKCSLYALTWLAIDDCDGKLDDGFRSTAAPLGTWKTDRAKWTRKRRRAPTLDDNSVPQISSHGTPPRGDLLRF